MFTDKHSDRARGHSVLLIVDDEPLILRSLARMAGRHFDEVLRAANFAEADQALMANQVTHLICDYFLGNDAPLGVELIPGWRAGFATIERAVLFSGMDMTGMVVPSEVDEVVTKDSGFEDLLAALKVGDE